MRIGIPKEVKPDEYRVAMMPVGVELLVKAGHEVRVETNAGVGSGFADEDYTAVGAQIISGAAEIFAQSDMIIKVKEPQPQEIKLFRKGLILFTYFHLAASRELTQACLDSGIVAIAYETIKDRRGGLPCLTPMSEIAGKMSIQEGAKYLEKPMMGRGILLGSSAGRGTGACGGAGRRHCRYERRESGGGAGGQRHADGCQSRSAAVSG